MSEREGLYKLTILQAGELLDRHEVASVDLANACLNRIEKKNKEINAFITVDKEAALESAAAADKRIKSGKRLGVLDGVPLGIKDVLSQKGVRTTAGSRILENYISPFDATVVSVLKKAGAVILGKTNMDEFAMGSSTESSYFGPTKNPWDLERVPGGSSGGSAAAVAADMCLGALGSDTGGSIRQPAAYCGIVGLKPTYGAVSRYGLLAMASSLDQVGPMTKDVADAEIIFSIISGKDSMDSTSSNYEYKKLDGDNLVENLKGKKIGIPKEFFGLGLKDNVRKAVENAINDFKKAGAEIIDISLPHTSYALATYYIIMPAEVSSNLARFDGIRYGLSEEGRNLIDGYLETRAKGFGNEVKRRIMLGTYVLSAGYYDAYYKKAQKVRTLVKADYDRAWEKVDVLLTPVTPSLPFKIGEKTSDPLTMYLEDVMTVPINIAGVPALVMPCGMSNGLPVGLQLIGKSFEENKIFQIAKGYEMLRGKIGGE
ncbi:MAG: Asp-tRNA(Asn)/Glu-tRNA(Gln) amidotransferase subunit GatA [bacterium]|nr:Asp-tRNA(Asn)/Glu-tRNA(Gln) amidotransferase subunit GatA [bacterium]